MAGDGRRAPESSELWNITLNGGSFIGQAKSVKLPELKVKTEDWRSGGMDVGVKVDSGMESIAFEFTVGEVHPLLLEQFGRLDRYSLVVFKQAFRQPGGDGAGPKRVAQVITGRGSLNILTQTNPEPGKPQETSVTIDCVYYKLEKAGVTYHEIDAFAGTRIIAGVDQMAAARALIE